MNTGTNYADLFYSESARDITVLEKNVKDNPASAIARFLLLYYYKKNNSPAFEKFAKESSLYFNNPYWLQFQLVQAGLKKEESTLISSPPSKEAMHPVVTFSGNKNESEEEIIPFEPQEESLEPKDEVAIINNDLTKEEEIIPPESTDENAERLQHADVDNIEPPISSKEEEEEVAFGPKEESTEPKDTVAGTNNDLAEEEEEEVIPSESTDENAERSRDADVNNIEPPISGKEKEVAFAPKEEILETDQLNNNAPFENRKEEPAAFEPEEEIAKPSQPTALVTHLPTEDIIPFSQTPDMQTPVSNNAEEELTVFEPLHTVDYFASQGIKLKEEALMNDMLGKQMKSFTAWLKSMKKLHPGKLPEQNEVIEKIIQSSAEESNTDAEVLTEAMAEVLIKQNKEEKAIAMYQKLSLLNPSKSAYFAAKIENLKTR